ncbi:glycine zipper domain-containing protein [Sedimenticola selenatireducens]|uniref:glycine zipper domain-containing protein n=1 Tax=Sedimenticola selenatireducens TaxID=191960 RepID=UPI00048FA709|nr:glycine zipper domain-containing protein [Sedimenticola selenatireducens]
MKTLAVKVVPVILVGTMLTGCVTNQPRNDTESSTASSQSDSQRTKTEGAVFGALLGGLIGLAAGDEKGAVIGAAVGAGAGYLIGNEIAKRKEAYATNEDFLDAETARTAEFNQTAKAQHQRLRTEIAALDTETAALRKQYKSGKANRDQLLAKQKQLNEKIAKNQEFESTLQKEYEINSEILAEERKTRPASDPYLAKLEKENNDLKAQIEQLRDDSTQLAQINERLSV